MKILKPDSLRYSFLALSVCLAFSGPVYAEDFTIDDTDDEQTLILPNPEVSYVYRLTGALSEGRNKTLNINGPGDGIGDFTLRFFNLSRSDDSTLQILINADITSSVSRGFALEGGPTTYDTIVKLSGNTKVSNATGSATGAYLRGGQFILSENSTIETTSIDNISIGADINNTLISHGRIEATSSGLNDSNGILTSLSGSSGLINITLGETSELAVKAEDGAAYGINVKASGGEAKNANVISLGEVTVTSSGGDAYGIYNISSGMQIKEGQTTTLLSQGQSGKMEVNAFKKATGIEWTLMPVAEFNLEQQGEIIVHSDQDEANGISLSNNNADAHTVIHVSQQGDITVDSQKNGAGVSYIAKNGVSSFSLYNDGQITMANQGDGIHIDTLGAISSLAIVNDQNGYIMGGSNDDAAGISVHSVQLGRIENAGFIGSQNGYAVRVDSPGLNITNTGMLQGAIQTTTHSFFTDRPEITLSNGGIWQLTAEAPRSLVTGGIDNTGLIQIVSGNTATPGEYFINVGKNSLTNHGTLDLSGGGGNTLTIEGDYTGKNGLLLLDAQLNGDNNSRSDKLHITGDVLAGNTRVKVNNMGGSGDLTQEGISVINADGAIEGTFTLEGRAVAGAYDYFLHQRDGKWVLQSSLSPEPVPPGPTPPVPPGPTPPVPPGPTPPVPPEAVIRPEAIAYAQNLRLANTLFVIGEEQRRGVGTYTDPLSGEKRSSDLWLIQQGGHNSGKDSSGQLRSQANRYTVQLGGTLKEWQTPDGTFGLGLQAGYGYAHGNSHSVLTGYHTRSSVSGYSTGLYGSWHQNNDRQAGGYASTTIQYSWLKNSVNGEALSAEEYHSRGVTVSLEGGYDVSVWQDGQINGDTLYVRPHAQVVWMGVKADEHREANGTRVKQEGDGNVFSRTGIRMWMDKNIGEGVRLEPFVETNWLHNTNTFSAELDNMSDNLAGVRNQAEVQLGMKGQLSENVDVTVRAAAQFGEQNSRDLSGLLNVAMKF